MPKQKTLSKLKKDLWKVFALYIKLKESKDGEYVNCYTCEANLKIGTSNAHAGHCFTKKGYPGLYFEEIQIKPQCYHCNINLSGNTNVFIENLKQEIGEEAYQEMYNRRHKPVKMTRSDYQEKIAYYIEKVNQLQKELGVKYL